MFGGLLLFVCLVFCLFFALFVMCLLLFLDFMFLSYVCLTNHACVNVKLWGCGSRSPLIKQRHWGACKSVLVFLNIFPLPASSCRISVAICPAASGQSQEHVERWEGWRHNTVATPHLHRWSACLQIPGITLLVHCSWYQVLPGWFAVVDPRYYLAGSLWLMPCQVLPCWFTVSFFYVNRLESLQNLCVWVCFFLLLFFFFLFLLQERCSATYFWGPPECMRTHTHTCTHAYTHTHTHTHTHSHTHTHTHTHKHTHTHTEKWGWRKVGELPGSSLLMWMRSFLQSRLQSSSESGPESNAAHWTHALFSLHFPGQAYNNSTVIKVSKPAATTKQLQKLANLQQQHRATDRWQACIIVELCTY